VRRGVAIRSTWGAAALLVFAACSGAGTSPAADQPRPAEETLAEKNPASSETLPENPEKDPKPRRVDPREGGFDISLGEWAITPEAPALRPGPVTFVVHNRGTMAHGFEIELEGDSSGSGSGDIFKAEGGLLRPGESAKLEVVLGSGVHKIECKVEGHDDLGMEGPLEVREDAPLVKEKSDEGSGVVSVADFTFDPAETKVAAGTKVTWNNEDPAPHTVTEVDGGFDSGTLDPGDSFSFTFEKAGTYRYRCNIHPEMEGTVEVE
jgi:plastocyanin